MSISWEQFQEKYKSAPKETCTLIDSGLIPDIATDLLNSKNTTAKSSSQIIRVLSHFVLGLVDAGMLKSELGLSDEKTKSIIEILNSKKNVSEKNSATSLPEASKETREKLELRPENVPSQDATATNDAGARPLTREEVLKALAPTRTMAKDIASIKEDAEAPVHGYEAYQDLKKGSGE